MLDFQLQTMEAKISSASSNSTSGGGGNSDSSDSDRDDGCRGSPRLQRKRKRKMKNSNVPNHDRLSFQRVEQEAEHEDLSYVDTLPEVRYISHSSHSSQVISIIFLLANSFGGSDVQYLGNKVQNSRSSKLCSSKFRSSNL